MNADHAKQLAVGDEIGGSPVLGESDDLALREAADEPPLRNRIVGECLGQEIGVWESERECAAKNWGPVALKATPNSAERGGGTEPGECGIGINVSRRTEIREAPEPTQGGRGLTDESVPACDGVHHAGVVGRPLCELLGVVQIVGVAARRQGVEGVPGEA